MIIEKRGPLADAERRRFPRVAVAIPVKLARSKTQTVSGLIQNISPGGMLVRFSLKSAARLLPEAAKKSGRGHSYRAQFLVPLRQQHVHISVDCVVAHVSSRDRAPSAARVAIGFRFRCFKDTKTLRRFVLFIEEQLVPLEDYELYLHGRAITKSSGSAGIKRT